ncbi:MAG: hypothetical protein K6A92_07390 [Lachnospiraceae bacterium]|nr:hypothetical protein [Lachnospiraceae bacterium]
MTDAERFDQAIKTALSRDGERTGIGMLSEKLMHITVKNFYCSDPAHQEIKIGSHVADICVEDSIIEVQNGNFNKLRDKLEDFLENYYVTIAYPIPATKILTWVDPETGEITSSRKTGKKGSVMDAMRELYRIKRYLIDENLSVELLFVDLEEIRFQDGYARDRKKGSHRMERIPKGLNRVVSFHTIDDYAQLLPDPSLLPSPFTSADYRKAWKTTERNASIALLMLTQFGILERTGKKGNAYLYEIAKPYRIK